MKNKFTLLVLTTVLLSSTMCFAADPWGLKREQQRKVERTERERSWRQQRRGRTPGVTPNRRNTERYYGRRGRYQGKSVNRNNNTRHYGSRGRYQGKSTYNNGSTRYYGSRGKYLGRSRGGARYDQNGKRIR